MRDVKRKAARKNWAVEGHGLWVVGFLLRIGSGDWC